MNFLGELAGLGQAVGLVLSKQGMFGDFSPFQATAIRILAAVMFVWGWTALEGKIGDTFTALRQNLICFACSPWARWSIRCWAFPPRCLPSNMPK